MYDNINLNQLQNTEVLLRGSVEPVTMSKQQAVYSQAQPLRLTTYAIHRTLLVR
jgi:hypothetical protein